jgi:hypothetical protein
MSGWRFDVPNAAFRETTRPNSFGRALTGSRQKGEAALPWQAIAVEVALVQSQHLAEALAFRDPDERGIGKIHGKVTILLHEVLDGRNVLLLQGKELHRARLEDFQSALCASQEKDRRYIASTRTGQTLRRGS